MRNIKIVILTIVLQFILLIIPKNTSAQWRAREVNAFSASNLMDEVCRDKRYTNVYKGYDNIQGTPYLNKEFVIGEILSSDSILYTDIDLRYDVFTDEIQFKYNDQILVIGGAIKINYVKILDKYFHRLYYIENDNLLNGYFQLLVDGSCILYAKYRVYFQDMEESIGFNNPRPARFSEFNKKYYISFKKEDNPELISNKKQFLSLINDNGDVEDYIKKEKLNFNNEDDLIKIIKYYNSVQL